MKAKVYFSAIALLSTFAACSNEELATVANENKLNENEIVGANLVAQGMTVNLGNVGSRVAQDENGASYWEPTDQLALAWYNVEEDITTPQTEANWMSGQNGNTTIFANHLFSKCGGDKFVTKSNIYEGAHFLYFPYEYMSSVAAKEVDVNAKPQAASFDVEVLNEPLYVSAQDFINEADLDKETGVLEKEFVISPVVNVLKTKVTAEDAIQGNEFLGSMQIVRQGIYENGTAAFRTKGEIVPQNIAKVVRYTTGENKGEIDRAKTFKALEENAKSVVNVDKATNGLYTDITYAMPLSNEQNIVRAFTLPTDATTASDVEFNYTVAKEGYNLGIFVTNGSSADATNKETVGDMKSLLTAAGRTKDGKTHSLTNLIAGNGNTTPVALNINLLLSEFRPDYNIKNLKEWNLTVQLVDALNSLKKENEKAIVPTFVLSDNITFDEGEINTPAAGVIVKRNGKQLIVAEDATWPSNLKGEAWEGNTENGFLAVVVKDGVTLDVNDKAGECLDFYPEAGAVINLNEAASEIHLANDVAGSRINIVTYGAKVTLGGGSAADGVQNATIAYELPKGYKNYQVNNLIATEDQENFALVNTLVINKGVTFNLADVQNDEVEGDPYTGVNKNYSGVLNTGALQGVNIEMKGGIVNNVAVNDEDEVVEDAQLSNVIAVTGNSTIKDVNVANVTVKSGATLVLTTDVVLEEDDDMVSIEVAEITTEASSKITADEVVVKYGNWTNNGTSTTANGGKFEVKQ